MIVRACKVKSRHLIVRLRFNHVKKSIWLDSLPKVFSLAFPELSYKTNNSDYYISLPNGSEIWIGGLDDKERVEKILGNEYSTVFFNECSQIPHSSVSMTLTRLAEKNELTKKAYYDMNPSNVKSWTYWLFVKKINQEDNTPIKNPDNYVSMLMNPEDNLENIDSNYLDRLALLPERERNRFLHGLFAEVDDGQAYYSFRRDMHVVDSTEIIGGTIFIGMDFNVNPMTAVIFQFYDNQFFVHDEIYLENSDTFKMCHELNKRNLSGVEVIPDSTGKNRKTSGKTDFAILRENGFRVNHTHNPLVRDRVNNLNRLLESGRITINKKCGKLITDLEKVSWVNNELDQKTDSKLTHLSDCLCYGTWFLEPMVARKKMTTYGY